MSKLDLNKIDLQIHEKRELSDLVVDPFWGSPGIYVLLTSDMKISLIGYSDNIPVTLQRHIPDKYFEKYGYFLCSEEESEVVVRKFLATFANGNNNQ